MRVWEGGRAWPQQSRATRLIHLLEHDDLARGVDLLAALDRRLDNVTGREPCLGEVVELLEELLASDLGGDRELGLFVSCSYEG